MFIPSQKRAGSPFRPKSTAAGPCPMGGFGESINAKIDWTHFSAGVTNTVKELGVYRRRKKEPESLYFSWCAFPRYVL